MIVSVLPFKLKPGAVPELGQVFASNRILELPRSTAFPLEKQR